MPSVLFVCDAYKETRVLLEIAVLHSRLLENRAFLHASDWLQEPSEYLARYNESFTADRQESASEEDPYHAYAYDAIWTIALMLRGLGAHNGSTRQELEIAARSQRVGQALERLDFTGVTVSVLKAHREHSLFCVHSRSDTHRMHQELPSGKFHLRQRRLCR